jgi:hypothetical protein
MNSDFNGLLRDGIGALVDPTSSLQIAQPPSWLSPTGGSHSFQPLYCFIVRDNGINVPLDPTQNDNVNKQTMDGLEFGFNCTYKHLVRSISLLLHHDWRSLCVENANGPSQDDVKAVALPGSQSIQCTLLLNNLFAGLVYINMINISITLFS